jgi:rhodanese-related sulfurtransferase
LKGNVLLYAVLAIAVIVIIYKFFLTPKSTGADVNADKFEELSKENDVVILDVRSGFEFGGDKIKDARNISYTSGSFKSSVEQLDKSKTYLVYCATGSRSAGAVLKMKEMGFEKVYNLEGGISSWKSSGKQVVN